MKSVKTLLVSSAIAVSWVVSTAHANGFFNDEKLYSSQQQPQTFNASAHKDTTFWGYFNNDMSRETPKIDKVSSFDHSKHEGTYFWGVYHN